MLAGLLGVLVCLLVACGGSPDAGNGAPASLKQVPRNRTFISDCLPDACAGQFKDFDSFHPFQPGATTTTGYNFLYEPLYFYNAYSEEGDITPWIAESHAFNDDYTEVTIKIRLGVEWSDGQPWTAHDLVFTINMLKANEPVLLFSVDMKKWVKEAVAVDGLTARITLNEPNPRFVFSYFTANFDNGIPIVPKHIWEGKDAETFSNMDIGKGWPVLTGPYRLVLSTPEQRIYDRRDDWWAAKIGFKELPNVERVVFLPRRNEAKRVQNMLANDLDICGTLLPANIRTILDHNKNITTWSGKEAPYGYLDWWPVSMGFNNLEEPYNDPEMRWAVNHAINRRQLVEVGMQNAGDFTVLPFPDFPVLQKYTDTVDDLLKQYPVDDFDIGKTAAILTRKGYSKDEEGFWSKGGERLKLTVDVFEFMMDFTPVVVQQLRQAGIDASFRQTSDAYTRMSSGLAQAFIFGHGGSVRDPYFTLRLYQSRYVQPTGTPTPTFWRWKNAEFDQIVDKMGETDPANPELVSLFHQALEIWLPELPAIPLLQFYHRIPHNQTYWKNWPSEKNPYVNTAYWHRTFLLVLLGLEPAQ
jgi:peptide/nickel transport system substrate-binding protein